MTPLRILFICPQTTAIGGAARSARRLINGLRQLGHLVVQVSPDENVFPNERLQSKEHWLFHPSRGPQQYSDEVVLAIRSWDPDIVVGWYGTSGGFAAVSGSVQCSVPSIVCLRGNDIDLDFFRPDRHSILAWTLQYATSICCVSTEMTHKVSQWFQRKAIFIANAVDEDLFYPDPDSGQQFREKHHLPAKPILGLFGEFKAKRGLELLSNISRELYHWHLLIIGIIRPSIAHQVPPDSQVLDYISDDDELRAAYNACNLLIHPSRHDGMPNVVLEAMACGVPVIASPIGGLLDIHRLEPSLALCESVDDWNSTLQHQRQCAHDAHPIVFRTPEQEALDYVALISSTIELYNSNKARS